MLKNVLFNTVSLLLLTGGPMSAQDDRACEIPVDLLTESLNTDNQNTKCCFQNAAEVREWIAGLKCNRSRHTPPPPKLPRNFRWEGRYIVSDLGINVPFTWHGNDGDIQMIAGSEADPIFFTNLIFNNHLYTYTYKWPGLQPEFLPPLERCVPLIEFSLEDLNTFFATSRFVGREILQGKPNRCVNHFRVGVVLPQFPSGFYPRFPIALADIYVDQKDPTKFWQVLHFGLQNIYDPELDEWIVINKMSSCPGEIHLPAACSRCFNER